MLEPGSEIVGSAASLVTWLRAKGRSYRWLAERLTPAVTKAAVATWAVRTRAPGAEHAAQIQALTDGFVRADEWLPSIPEVESARRVMLRVARLMGPAPYVVCDKRGVMIERFDDVLDAKPFLDRTDKAHKLVRLDDDGTWSEEPVSQCEWRGSYSHTR